MARGRRVSAVQRELRLLCAYHEAGHAVAAALSGGAVSRVTTTRRGSRSGECALELSEVVRRPAAGADAIPAATRRRLARATVAVALGGTIAAEQLAREHGYELSPPLDGVRPLFAPGAEEDARIALAASAWLGRDAGAQRRFLRRVRGETERLLVSPGAWRAVRAVAGALLRAGTLDAKRARQVIARAMRGDAHRAASSLHG
jgi:hypothetical protein